MQRIHLELTDRFEVPSDGIFDESQRIESKTTGVGGALDRYRTLAYGDIPRGENPDNRYETILKSASEIKTVSTDISTFLSHPGEGIRNKAKSKGKKKVILHSRENTVDFYKKNGFSLIKKSHIIFNSIQHYLMEKAI